MMQLLVIDDEEGIRRSVKRALAKENYDVHVAANGQEALDHVRAHASEVAIVVSDYKMPGINGLETLVAIGALNPEIVRILLTGYATMDVAIQATNQGIDGFLTKPFDNNELRAKIREYFVRKRVQQLVPPAVLEQLQRDPSALAPRQLEASVLFADIRGFTAIAERLAPTVLARLLNDYYFSPLGDVVFEHRGTLDKYLGDGLMALFGAPIDAPDHAAQAVAAALAMQARMAELQAAVRAEAGVEFPIGIGVASGTLAAGVFGSRTKKDYTALGGTVNLAARLEGRADAGEILVAETTWNAVRDRYDGEAMEPLGLRGLERKVNAWRIRGPRP